MNWSQSDPTRLDAARIRSLLSQVDYLLDGHPTELLVVGGAALTVYWDEQGHPREKATYDIDAVVVLPETPQRTTFKIDVVSDKFPPPLKQAINEVEKNNIVDDGWFNNYVVSSLDNYMNFEPEILFQGRNLTVHRPSPRAQLALKLIASRRKDIEDTRRLISETGINTLEGLGNLVTEICSAEDFDGFAQRFAMKRLAELGLAEEDREEIGKPGPGES